MKSFNHALSVRRLNITNDQISPTLSAIAKHMNT